MEIVPSPQEEEKGVNKEWDKGKHNDSDDDDDDDVSEASSVLYLKDCAEWTVRLAPARQPLRWFLINLLWAGASVTILFDTLLSLDHARARIVAEELYLVYNGSATAIWCLEVSLTVLARRVTQRPLTWPIWLEVCLAFVFWWDSIQLIMAWQVRDVVMMSNVYDALLNIIAYLYVAYECWMHCSVEHHQQQQQQQHGNQADEVDIERGSVYRSMDEKELQSTICMAPK